MKNKHSGFLNILLIILLGVGALYYFKIDVKSIINFFEDTYSTYFIEAKNSVEKVDWKEISGTTTPH